MKELAREAEEQRIAEEKAKKEQEEFEKWSSLISVDETGEIGVITAEDREEKTKKFIQFVEKKKVVMLEELAAEFNMQTKDVVKKIELLESAGRLTGITDDRGKFIHITEDKFNAITEYIKTKGECILNDS